VTSRALKSVALVKLDKMADVQRAFVEAVCVLEANLQGVAGSGSAGAASRSVLSASSGMVSPGDRDRDSAAAPVAKVNSFVRPVPSGLMAPVTVDTSSPAARNRSLRMDKSQDLSSRKSPSSRADSGSSKFSSRRSSKERWPKSDSNSSGSNNNKPSQKVMLNSPRNEGQMLVAHHEEGLASGTLSRAERDRVAEQGDRSVHASPRLSVSRLALRRQTAPVGGPMNGGIANTNFSSRAAPSGKTSGDVPAPEKKSPDQRSHVRHGSSGNWSSILMDTQAPPEQQISLSGSSRSQRMSERLRSLDSPADRSPPETPPAVSMTPRFVRPLDSPGMRFRELQDGKSKLKSTLDRALELVPELDISKYHLIKEAFVKALVQLEQSTYDPNHGS
jgi:hypothetical protein